MLRPGTPTGRRESKAFRKRGALTGAGARGVPMSLPRRLALLRWASAVRAWVIEDAGQR